MTQTLKRTSPFFCQWLEETPAVHPILLAQSAYPAKENVPRGCGMSVNFWPLDVHGRWKSCKWSMARNPGVDVLLQRTDDDIKMLEKLFSSDGFICFWLNVLIADRSEVPKWRLAKPQEADGVDKPPKILRIRRFLHRAMPKAESVKPSRREAAVRAEAKTKQSQQVENASETSLNGYGGGKSGTVSAAMLKRVPIDKLVKIDWGEKPKEQVKWYTGKPPTRTSEGVLHFEDAPKFTPNMTPAEIFQAGSFGGYYYRPISSEVTGKVYEAPYKEFPKEWFAGLNIDKQVASPVYDAKQNKYRVKCGQDLREWEQQNWITEQDPYGWVQWYCRFYLGRRSTDDERQIQRWHNAASSSGRWRNNLLNKIYTKHGKHIKGYLDESVSPVVRQVLQHWAYAVTERDYRQCVESK